MKKVLGLFAITALLAGLLANCESKKEEGAAASSSTSTLALGLIGDNSPLMNLTPYLYQQIDIGDRSINSIEFKLLPDPLLLQSNRLYNEGVVECRNCNEPFTLLQVRAVGLGVTSLHIGVQEKTNNENNEGQLIGRVELKFAVLLGEKITNEGFSLSGPRDVVAGTRAVYLFQSPEAQNNLSRVAGFLANPGLALCDDAAAPNKNICIEPIGLGSSMQLVRQNISDNGLTGLGFNLPASDEEVVLLTRVLKENPGYRVALFDGADSEQNFSVRCYAGLADLVPAPSTPTNLTATCRKQIITDDATPPTTDDVACTHANKAQAMWAQLNWSQPQLENTASPYALMSLMYQIERCSKNCSSTTIAGPHDVPKTASWQAVARITALSFRDPLAYRAQAYTQVKDEQAHPQPGQVYSYRVRAVGGLASLSPASEQQSVAFSKLPPMAPSAVTLVQHQPNPFINTAVEADKVIVSWQAPPKKGGHQFVSYRVEGCVDECDDEANWAPVTNGSEGARVNNENIQACAQSPHSSTKCADDLAGGFTSPSTSFTALTTTESDTRQIANLHYRVRACGVSTVGTACSANTDKAVGRSSTSSGITLYRAPSVPRNIVKTADGDERVQLSWQEPEDLGGATLINYIVEASQVTGHSGWQQHATANTTSWQGPHIVGRKYRVRARNAKSFISAPSPVEGVR